MWQIISGPEALAPTGDNRRFRFLSRRDTEQRETIVEIVGTACACDANSLPHPINKAVRTKGRDAIQRYIAEGDLPTLIKINTITMWPSIRPIFDQ
jgi:hypothetical protein